MPLLPPLITHSPNSDPLFKSVNTAGIVKTIVAGTGVAVNSIDPANPVVSAPTLLPRQTAFEYDSGAIVIAQPVPAGFDSVNVGATFEVPATGLYIITATIGVNVGPAVGATFGLADSLVFQMVPTPPVMGVNPVGIQFRPYSMPATDAVPAGFDYGMQASQVVEMTTGVPYQLKADTYNVSGTMDAAGGLAGEIRIVALC